MAKRVIDIARPATRIEAGSADFPDSPTRCAILVHFSTGTRLTRSVVRLTEELHANGYFVVISSACEADGDLVWPTGTMPSDTIVLRKPNIGYDFGTAAVALDFFPAIAASDFALIVNDSNAGPFVPLREVIAAFEATKADAWALTGSRQHGFHLQSFFLGFRRGILAERTMSVFWRDIKHHTDKRHVIRNYEIGLSQLLLEEGYTLDVMYPHTQFDSAGSANLSVNLWLDLLAVGYPFVKREIVQKPWIDSTAHRVPDVVRYFFGEDVYEWL